MVEIIKGLYVGSDEDFASANSKGFAICSCCKDGPHGHRSILKYTALGAPKDQNYYFVERGKHMALNLVDSDDPHYIPEQAIDAALRFVDKRRRMGDTVLVHCNQGHSRGPTTTLMYLRSIGEMPYSFARSESIFKTLYPRFEPEHGMRQYARAHWSLLENVI